MEVYLIKATATNIRNFASSKFSRSLVHKEKNASPGNIITCFQNMRNNMNKTILRQINMTSNKEASRMNLRTWENHLPS